MRIIAFFYIVYIVLWSVHRLYLTTRIDRTDRFKVNKQMFSKKLLIALLTIAIIGTAAIVLGCTSSTPAPTSTPTASPDGDCRPVVRHDHRRGLLVGRTAHRRIHQACVRGTAQGRQGQRADQRLRHRHQVDRGGHLRHRHVLEGADRREDGADLKRRSSPTTVSRSS